MKTRLTNVIGLAVGMIWLSTNLAQQSCPSVANSTHGDVPFGTVVCSTDQKKLQAKEVAPRGNGRIGVFSSDGKTLITTIQIVGEVNNPLKVLGWVPGSSELLIVGMHHAGGNFLTVLDTRKGAERPGRLQVSFDFHYLKFESAATLSVSDAAGRQASFTISK